jgi:TIR domain
MATLFLSYKLEDRELAERFQGELETLGHTIRVDTNAVLVGSGWRDSLMRALMESDAVVALITERSLRSPFVISEIGAARALSQTGKKTALLPVIIGDMPIPVRRSRGRNRCRSAPRPLAPCGPADRRDHSDSRGTKV